MLPRAAVLAAALALAGCNPAPYWTKPGATRTDLRIAVSDCEAESFARFPPVLESIPMTPAVASPSTLQCTGFGASRTCFITGGGYTPPGSVTYDRTEASRFRSVQACLLRQGWRQVDRQGRPAS